MTTPTYKPPTSPAGYVSEAYYTQILDEFVADTPTELVWPNSIPTYAAMRRDATCSAVLDGWLLQLLRATWQLDGRGCDPELTRMVADDLGLRVVGSDESGGARTRGVSWEDHLAAALSAKLVFGHMGFALGAEMRDGQARLKVLAERLPQTLTEIHADPKTGEFLGVTQDAARRSGKPQILARNMAWYCHRREGANWAGTSMFRSAWTPFRVKKEMIRIHAMSNQRWGAGVPVMEALPGTQPSPLQMAEAQQLASDARAGLQSGMASPPGFTMKILGLTGGIPDTLAFIEWLDRQVSRASLMPHIELGQGSTGGSRALGTAFIDSFMLALETLAEQTAMEATRQISGRIVEWNRGPDEPVPSVVVSGIGSKREVTAESLNMLLQSGALSADPGLEAWIRREYRLPERQDADGQAVPSGRIFESDVAQGVLTKNERRAMFNLPPVEGGDTLPDTRPAADRTATPPQVEKPVAAKRRSQTSGQLELPIAAAAEDDEARRVQADYEAALAALLAAWPMLAAPLVDDLVFQVEAGVALTSVVASALTVDGITAGLLTAMAALANQAGEHVVASAAAHGVTVDQPPPDEGRLAEVAAVTAGLVAGAYTGAAVRRAMLAPAGQAGVLVRAALDDMSSAQRGTVADNLGAALAVAQGQGRLAAIAASPPRLIRATEKLDPSACEECRQVDGKTYRSLAEAAEDYGPTGMLRCAGRSRCRGQLIPIY